MKQDESLHRLLGRAAQPRGDVRPEGTCLDAETLAAWTDGVLSPVKRTAAETHAADCARCLAVLAAIARTAPPPSATERPAWLSVRWLAPLTAAAVALSAWVIIQEAPRPIPPAAPPPAVAVDTLKAADPAVPPERDVRAEAGANPAEKKAESPPSFKDQTEARRAAKAPAVGAVAAEPQTASPPQPPPAVAAPAPPAFARADAQRERLQSAAGDALAEPRLILSPDPDVRWRLAGERVERSTDGGRTWQTQSTGTTLELLAGSAPAPSVCWLVGRSGLVLLSTNGETWRRVPFPDATADVVGVTARDGVSATVTTADGRTYRTTDAGRTWTLQENPAAPF